MVKNQENIQQPTVLADGHHTQTSNGRYAANEDGVEEHGCGGRRKRCCAVLVAVCKDPPQSKIAGGRAEGAGLAGRVGMFTFTLRIMAEGLGHWRSKAGVKEGN